ncbi:MULTISPECIES: nuclear transport factor 2 family protein [Sphingobacterium]|uniref:Nuclear transport factor 2 family protein n=1 Tax=Sphingobacterium litopenaei TaxID=2763500 RepID=A0ABR7YA59_9SPHI|nr:MULTISPECIES: nuclear transport factor 2 family protein [Sphingobacterium]MBD1428189.1 nuclear transport factor 2 family protein [Sphingobacterium litopenaei]NGM74171.1 nuclear transport factor 2 family protein [Sphingobacterium sp. SGL-16]
MKKTLSTIATAFLMIVSLSSFANVNINPLKEKDSKAIMVTYVEAIVLGSDVYNKYLFTEDFEYQNTANNDKFSRKQYLKFLKDTRGLKFDCQTDYQILDEVGKSCVAKATMKFENFTRVDYITMQKTKDGWKVNKVVTTYP